MAGPNPSRTPIDAVVFGLGGVLIDWHPRAPYRKPLPGDEAAMETFLATLYIDDNSQNVEVARGLGFRVHHFQSPRGLQQAITDHGL